ncbi:hypothetical protein PLESTB_001672500 [Pleodorina starrii]|uniref:Uncharacterized protein n=1 Tax=Pleodorina starrii TaxID=330485 RepID=A0A9W6C0C3_9CHLO|nr:hypothetical protein PLESTM_000622100 [Pleodorina starrii]GLC60801.1 hypothetical protein PLESTB_001672500 [Pleodorina starrii]GLC75520.1 hypothetical protein PLESTF_001646900 [Pleodorina starrii]
MLRTQPAVQPSSALGVCLLAQTVVSRTVAAKATPAAALPLQPQQSPQGALEALRVLAPGTPWSPRFMPGPATIVSSSGLDFIDFIVGMDAREADSRFRDAQTFRTLFPCPNAAPEPPPRTAERRSGSGLNLKQLTSFRDHVTRNLAPTVAHGFVKATAATRQPRASSSSTAAGAGQTAVGSRPGHELSSQQHPSLDHRGQPSRPPPAQPTAVLAGAVNNIVPAESLHGLRPIAADSALPSSLPPLGPVDAKWPSEDLGAATRSPTAASPATLAAVVTAELDSPSPLLDAAPLFAALACGGGSWALLLPTSPHVARGDGAPPGDDTARPAPGEAGGGTAPLPERGPALLPPQPQPSAASGAVVEEQSGTGLTVATAVAAAAAAESAPQRRRRGSRVARVADAGRRGGAGAGAGTMTAAWM